MPTRLITLPVALLVALLAALAMPLTAGASGDDVIRDCAEDGDLDNQYSDEELQDASENMPSDIDAYSDCRDVIRQAQAGGRGSSGSSESGGPGGSTGGGGNGENGPGGAGATASDAEELSRRQQEAQDGTAPSDSAALAAGADAGDDSGLPTAALVAIVLLGLAAVGGGVYLLRDYLPPGLTSRLPGASR